MTWKPDVTAGRIRGFDGLRALAIIMVFLSHKTTFGAQIDGGAAGVMLFFVLSGYLITGILLKDRYNVELGNTSRRAEIFKFFANRSFRIFPAYYAMLGILFAISLILGERVSHLWALSYVTYTTNIGIAYFEKTWAPLGHLWTLAVEEQFYIIAAPLFLLTPIRRAHLVVLGIWAAGAISWICLKLLQAPSISFATDSFVNYAMLATGSFLALRARRGDGADSRLIGGGLLLLVAPPALGLLFPSLQIWQPFGAPGHIDTIYAAMVVYGVIANQKSKIVSLLEFTPLRLLGRVSYAFYLWHYVIDMKGIAPVVGPLVSSPTLTLAIVVAIDFALTVAVATASWWLLESPMLRMRDRLMRERA